MRLTFRSLVSAALLAASALAGPRALAQDSLWSLARDGDEAKLVGQIRKLGDEDALARRGEHFAADLEKREQRRSEEIEKVSAELAEHMTKAKDSGSVVALSEALRSAVELEMLSADHDAFHARPEIEELASLADEAAHKAEADHDWIMASELFYRLNVLFDDSDLYRDDTERQSTRLAMLRLYTPERFWELRNARRLLDGEDPLPPYNAFGDHYTEKLAGVDLTMVHRALTRGARYHVEGVGLGEMIVAGIDSAITMARTTDLSPAFPGLGNPAAVNAFVSDLERERRVIEADRDVNANELSATLRAVLGANEATVQVPTEALLHEFGNGAMEPLDPFSAIIWPDELRRFQRSTTGSFVGVGIQIQLDEQLNIKVVTPLEGTPAHRAGIQAGDLIRAVNGRSTVGFTVDQAVDVITGPMNTDVTLTIERETEDDQTEQLDFDITRARIPLESVKGWRKTGGDDLDWDWFIDRDAGIGYIRLTQFVDSTSADFDRAVSEMKRQGLNGLVLDLRYNPGGLLNQAVEICSRFVPRGDIVTTHDADDALRDHEPVVLPPASRRLYDLPVIVLVNQNSASASEIVAGAIQDYAHNGDVQGLIVGERSFGKGSVQNVWGLSADAAMKLTTQYYKLPNGRLIHRRPGDTDWGIDPDLTIEMLPSQQIDAITLRQNADVVAIDGEGKPVADDDRPDPDTLLSDGLDLQLEAAMVLLRSRVDADQIAANEATQPVTN